MKLSRTQQSVIILMIGSMLSSCYHYTPIISRKDPDRDNVGQMMLKVQPGKSYSITLRDNSVMIVKVLVVEKDRMSGEVETVHSKITRIFTVDEIFNIKERKFSVVNTVIAVAVPTAILVGALHSIPVVNTAALNAAFSHIVF